MQTESNLAIQKCLIEIPWISIIKVKSDKDSEDFANANDWLHLHLINYQSILQRHIILSKDWSIRDYPEVGAANNSILKIYVRKFPPTQPNI